MSKLLTSSVVGYAVGLAWSPSIGLVVGGGDYVGDEFTRRGFLARLVP